VKPLRSFLLVLILGLVSLSSAQTVVQRIRLGNSVEGMTYVNNGPLAGHIVLIDGEKLIGAPAESRGAIPFLPLFDLTPLGYPAAPRGVGWISSERLFIFTDPTVGGASTTFQLADYRGRQKSSITFQWPDYYAQSASYVEEVAWVPLDAPQYAGDLIFIAWATAPIGDEYTTAFVMDRQGNYVDAIPLPVDATGLAYRAPGYLLLGSLSAGYLYEIDLSGNQATVPVSIPDAFGMEGVAVLASGRVAVTSHADGKIIYLDANLNRLPQERSYRVGFGLSLPGAVAWDSAANQFVVWAGDIEPTMTLPQLGAISANGRSAHLYFDMAPFTGQSFGRMDYVRDVDAVVMPFRSTSPRILEYFSPSGSSDGPIIGDGSRDYRLNAFAYLPDGGFIARRTADTTLLTFFDSNAQPTGMQFDLSASIQSGALVLDVAPFPTWLGEQRYLVLTSETPQRLLTLDAAGNLLATADATRLSPRNLSSVKYISSGPKAGSFVALNPDTNELIVFRLR